MSGPQPSQNWLRCSDVRGCGRRSREEIRCCLDGEASKFWYWYGKNSNGTTRKASRVESSRAKSSQWERGIYEPPVPVSTMEFPGIHSIQTFTKLTLFLCVSLNSIPICSRVLTSNDCCVQCVF
ncbi:hypothetical protein ILYODFUR_037111 [Ilyodon furcidens]|uniref:Uncharacterized protein n=1 Tax=Ilyodon furcidens TaxID=33524 RepID=A0ABV0VB05_9TELE